MNSDKKEARKSLWRQRGRRAAIGFNVWSAIILGAVVLVMVNYVAYRYYFHWDNTSRGYYRLSDKTRGLLASLNSDVDVVAFFPRGHELYDDVRYLLQEYEYEAKRLNKLNFKVTVVDPVRDFAAAREIAEKYDVHNANIVVFQAGGRRKYLGEDDINDYKISMDRSQQVKKRSLFRGEQAFSSAIQEVTQNAVPVVYFLSGHGEHSVDDYGKSAGYSGIAQTMGRDKIVVKTLVLAGQTGVPEDCCTLVIAGPQKELSAAELALLSGYLDRNGRILFLLDAGIRTGLDDLLVKWDVKLNEGVVVDPQCTRTGRELIITEYSDHPVTRNLAGVLTTFYNPRSTTPLTGALGVTSVTVDKPRALPLVSCSGKGWEEMDLTGTAVFDAGFDSAGPVPIAVAVEKGPVIGIDVEIKPTRMVVIGDSDFISNGGLADGGGGNEYLFMSSINWLVEREALMAIPPRPPGELRLAMNGRQMRIVLAVIALAGPGVLTLLGVFVLVRRRR